MTRVNRYKQGEKKPEPVPQYKREKKKQDPRLSIILTQEQREGLNRIPWGLRNQTIRKMIEKLNDMMDKEGVDVVTAKLISERITLADVMQHSTESLIEELEKSQKKEG